MGFENEMRGGFDEVLRGCLMPNQAPARKSNSNSMKRTLLLLLSLAMPVIAETWSLDHVEEKLIPE